MFVTDVTYSQVHYSLEEASATDCRKLGGDRRTTTGGTGSIMLAGILNKSEYARTVNTTTNRVDLTHLAL